MHVDTCWGSMQPVHTAEAVTEGGDQKSTLFVRATNEQGETRILCQQVLQGRNDHWAVSQAGVVD